MRIVTVFGDQCSSWIASFMLTFNLCVCACVCVCVYVCVTLKKCVMHGGNVCCKALLFWVMCWIPHVRIVKNSSSELVYCFWQGCCIMFQCSSYVFHCCSRWACYLRSTPLSCTSWSKLTCMSLEAMVRQFLQAVQSEHTWQQNSTYARTKYKDELTWFSV